MNANSPDREWRELTRLAQLTVGKPEANVARVCRVSFAAEGCGALNDLKPLHLRRIGGATRSNSPVSSTEAVQTGGSMALNIDFFMLLRRYESKAR